MQILIFINLQKEEKHHEKVAFKNKIFQTILYICVMPKYVYMVTVNTKSTWKIMQ